MPGHRNEINSKINSKIVPQSHKGKVTKISNLMIRILNRIKIHRKLQVLKG